MKATSVTAHCERKLNTGDYSSVTFSTWATVEVEEGDTAEGAMAYGMDICRDAIKEATAPFRKNGQPVTSEEKFAGLKMRPVQEQSVADLDYAEVAPSGADYGTGGTS